MQNLDEILLRKHCKERAFVITTLDPRKNQENKEKKNIKKK
jgi:hypothetical protein